MHACEKNIFASRRHMLELQQRIMLWMKTIKQSHWRQISISFDVIVSPLLVSTMWFSSATDGKSECGNITNAETHVLQLQFNWHSPVLKGHLMQYAFNLLTWWQIEKGLRLYHFSPGYWFNILFGRNTCCFSVDAHSHVFSCVGAWTISDPINDCVAA